MPWCEKLVEMLRRLFARSIFCARREIGNQDRVDRENSNRETPELFFEKFRIGWWPVIADRDRPLIEALASGRYRLLGDGDRDDEWAYAAVEVGPLHTELVRWHFSTSRWFRMPKNGGDENNNDWCIRWRPLPRSPDDAVSGVAQGPFRNWEVLAGEMNSSAETKEHCAAIILRTTRKKDVAICSTSVFSLILVSDHGRNKQGYLLSPAPDDDRKSDRPRNVVANHVAYRRQNQELHFFSQNREKQSITWYRYRKRGRRVYWLDGKQEIRLPETAFSKIYDLRRGDILRLIADLDGRHGICIEFNLERDDWSLSSAAEKCKSENDPEQELRTIASIETTANFQIAVPICLKFDSPFTLKSLSARTILRHTHPKFLNNRSSLIEALPADRFVLRAINELLARQ